MDNKTLLAVHALACTAVARIDRNLSTADDQFWPVYLRAALIEIMPIAAELRDLVTPGVLAALSERRRQSVDEGFDAAHDDEHDAGELAAAAAAYALAAADKLHPFSQGDGGYSDGRPPVMWPWDPTWWKPSTPQRDLEKAAALIIAEIEKMDSSMAGHASEALRATHFTQAGGTSR
ncbi:hypothetical protein QYH69_29525 [Paraburkholderia sp. SARCC-3016]|uniref:hypothetical protein n=1 Tax=Paraburkholderia sp. SARCC-3016 TaxID=3058611 RepID=UPI0028088E97|nr:hypothetical protein [Paraburkholderia sp. SARCC-3016]MDQ7981377.1 hypothetical protein [Paraburkholderia sp. SARCC-3016]